DWCWLDWCWLDWCWLDWCWRPPARRGCGPGPRRVRSRRLLVLVAPPLAESLGGRDGRVACLCPGRKRRRQLADAAATAKRPPEPARPLCRRIAAWLGHHPGCRGHGDRLGARQPAILACFLDMPGPQMHKD